ncbi:rhodanese-like domain-containing protein [Leptolyngbyaceae cyanobacterium CCMR0082]|uniref:Rhodanese-like domain-containing protein n=2 Tax=Adonisia turfae TaxID=2950184 RepID=A0A6M0S0G8_9CYAN|nr:rhodanese-like domain-containing protein [Adonisia turfae]NEZ61441.1 rhodanese-like domain-containing protein [Adonisia turfae CCMR0082]
MAVAEQLSGLVFEAFTPHEVQEQFERHKIVLIDVRTPQEYAFEHIPGAMLFPMASFDPRKLPIQADEKPIVLYCGSGRRSRLIAEKCIDSEIDRIAHMEGGISAWKEAGLTYVSIDPATGGYVHKPQQ